MNHRLTARTSPSIRRSMVYLLSLAGISLLAAGCGSSGSISGSRPFVSSQSSQLDLNLVIGSRVARELGYEVDWQYAAAGSNLKLLTVQHDSVFTLDENNYLTRIDREDGTRVWRIPISYPLAEIQGVTYLPDYDRVLILSGGDLYILHAADGSQIARQHLEKVANTEALPFDDQIIYGSRNGQLIWHSHVITFQSNGYQIANSIKLTPLRLGQLIVVTGNDGELAVIDASSASKYWSKKLLDGIVTSPVIGNGVLYVAGLDQHVWAFDLGSGRNLWRYLTETPLRDSPVVIGDVVLQQVPREGLICFEALPKSKPGGAIIWSAKDVAGNVVTTRRENLIIWDQKNRQLDVLTALRGGHVSSTSLPLVDILMATSTKDGDIYAYHRDGRVVRLVPRN